MSEFLCLFFNGKSTSYCSYKSQFVTMYYLLYIPTFNSPKFHLEFLGLYSGGIWPLASFLQLLQSLVVETWSGCGIRIMLALKNRLCGVPSSSLPLTSSEESVLFLCLIRISQCNHLVLEFSFWRSRTTDTIFFNRYEDIQVIYFFFSGLYPKGFVYFIQDISFVGT